MADNAFENPDQNVRKLPQRTLVETQVVKTLIAAAKELADGDGFGDELLYVRDKLSKLDAWLKRRFRGL